MANPSPSCGGLAAGTPDPFHGTANSLVLAGGTNANFNTHTETITCVAAVPTMPRMLVVGLGALLAGGGAWWLRRRCLASPRVS